MSKICLCCGKEINENTTMSWHKECLYKFFGTYSFPDVSVLESEIEKLAIQDINKNFSITGVQKKLSLGLSIDKRKRRLTLINVNPEFIIKTQDAEIPYIVECEQLVMLLANEIGIQTVKHGLIKTKNNGFIYISRRIDRKNGMKIAMEDFCQLSNKLTEYKYQGSYEKCAKEILDIYSMNKTLDKINLFRVLYFSYLVGNTDMHLKNFSLIDDDGYHLSPFYDLTSPEILVNQNEIALSLNGKRKKLTKNDFLNFAINISLDKELALKLMKNINIKLKNCYPYFVNTSFLNEDLKKKFINLIEKRIDNFKV